MSSPYIEIVSSRQANLALHRETNINLSEDENDDGETLSNENPM